MNIWWNSELQVMKQEEFYSSDIFFDVLFLQTEEKPDIQEPLKIKIETTTPGVEDKPKPNPSPTRLLTTLLSSKTSKVEDLKELKEVGIVLCTMQTGTKLLRGVLCFYSGLSLIKFWKA